MSELVAAWRAFESPLNDGWTRLAEHVEMSLVSLALAGILGLALGIACWKLGPVAAALAVGLGNLGRAVPTFAAMALVLALSTVGMRPAIVGLVLLGVPPVLLNVYTGLAANAPPVLEAARGMGLGPMQTLLRVELPLAVPFIMAGLQTAGVQIVATAALAGAIGAGGLGLMIEAGLTINDDALVLAGAIPVVLLSLLVEGALVVLARVLTPEGLRIVRRSARLEGRTA